MSETKEGPVIQEVETANDIPRQGVISLNAGHSQYLLKLSFIRNCSAIYSVRDEASPSSPSLHLNLDPKKLLQNPDFQKDEPVDIGRQKAPVQQLLLREIQSELNQNIMLIQYVQDQQRPDIDPQLPQNTYYLAQATKTLLDSLDKQSPTKDTDLRNQLRAQATRILSETETKK